MVRDLAMPFGTEDPDVYMALEDLELVARGIVEGALHGLHRSVSKGFSVEFDSHREYIPGDDLRHVNWKLWGRTDRLYVKQFRSDTNLDLYIMLDQSGSMCCDHGPSSKWKYGVRLAAAMAFLALHNRDAAGIGLLSDRLDPYIAPRVKPGQFDEILATLHNSTPAGQADIANAIDDALTLFNRRGIVLLISDLYDTQEAILNGLINLRYYGHEVIVMHVIDPWEAALPERGQYQFKDLETTDTVQVDVAQLHESYAKVYRDWQSGFQSECQKYGIEWFSFQTSDPLCLALVHYLLRSTKVM